MEFASFFFFSSLEYIAFVYFVLILFRFSVKESIWKFSLFAVFLSLVSNALQTESLQAISPLVQALLMIVSVTIILRIHYFNAFIMVITGYVINTIVQWIIIAIAIHLGSEKVIIPYTTNAYIIQSASAFLMVAFSIFTYLQNGGFSFIDNQSRIKRQKVFIKENRQFIVFLLISFALTIVSNLLFLLLKNPPYLLFSIILIMALLSLLYLTVKRDGKEYG